MINNYKSSYTWPNPAFPFRVYLDHPNLRIFIIENIHHNWNWMKEYASKFQERDIFFVYCGWFHGENFLREDLAMLEALNLPFDKFYFLFNSEEEMKIYRSGGFDGDLINQNTWLDANDGMYPLPEKEKIYDAIYVARHSPFKRHVLTNLVPRLALVMGNTHGNPAHETLPSYVYKNEAPLPLDQVREKINMSRCGLILSDTEGACFASSEYLLCGIPVVSTKSHGGRDVWYDKSNSIICDPTEASVRDAVAYVNSREWDCLQIRKNHLTLMDIFKRKFINKLEYIFYKRGVDIVADVYFNENYMHKLRKSYRPDFNSLFAAAGEEV